MDLLIGDIFRNAARAVPGRVAVAVGDQELTFAQVEARSNQVARALIACGTGHGDRVVAWSNTTLDVVPLFAAAAKVGAVFAPASPLLGATEGAEVIGSARPSLIAADRDRFPMAAEIGTQLGVPALCIDGLAHGGGDLLGQAADEQPDSELPSPAALHEGDPHVVFFTSGSTGRPKGVVLSHRVNILRSHPGALLEPRGALVCPYPLFHMGAWTLALQQWQARDVVVFSNPDASAICAAIARHRATRMNAIPAVWRRVLDHLASPAGRDADVSSLRFADTGTSATPPELLAAIAAAFDHAWVRVFYGSTESGSVASLQHDDVGRKPGSCGAPSPFAEVRVAGTGELWVRGPLLFDGYFDNEEATAEVLVDGWYRSGDLVEVDGDGYLTVIGRARDVIRTGGETVAPREVEEVIGDEPSVADVAVVGVPDVTWGEIVCAVVVVRAGHPAPDVERLRAHCAGRLAPFKQPRRVAITDAIPRTASTSQVQRRLLVERIVTGGTAAS